MDPRLSQWTGCGGLVSGYLLLPDSPALNAGSNALAVDADGEPLAVDLRGEARIQDNVVDVGAVEGAHEPTAAVTYVVDDLGDGVAEDGRLTFREALAAANSNRAVGDAPAGSFTETDRIEFAVALFGRIATNGREFVISGNLDIAGPGSEWLAFDGRDESRVFRIVAGTEVSISNVTITRGHERDGGGIHNGGALTLDGVALADNMTTRNGGGIYSQGTLMLTNATVTNNQAAYGGGIYSEGALIIEHSHVASNSGSIGGGVFSGGEATISHSKIADNSAGKAGGIRNEGTLTVINSAVTRNRGNGTGGIGNQGTLTVRNSTIAGNSSIGDGAGGIYNGSNRTPTLTNTIIAQNTSPTRPDVRGVLDADSDYNLIGIWSEGTAMPGQHSLSGTRADPLNPGLSEWSDLGGGAWGYSLLPESPAVNAGNNALAVDADGNPLETDLYGNPRIQGGMVDIGAFESSFVSAAAVVGRYVFYNNSTFDGHAPDLGPEDDYAIATDKQALRPGEVASLANYTSYSRGINGIMVDVAGLSDGYTPDAAHFEFKVGDGDDPSTWQPAAEPVAVGLREGAGVGGSGRISIAWADFAVRNRWLQVTLSAESFGLAANDVFYFGNAVAEAGNTETDTLVTATDLLLARNNPRNFLDPADVDFAYDYNRDRRVNATDVLLARNNQTNFLTALKLLDLSGEAAAKRAVPSQAAGETPRWLSEYDLPSTKVRSPATPDSATDAVDKLLTAYWP